MCESDFYFLYMQGYLQQSENDPRTRSSQVLSISTTILGLLGSFKNTRLKWQILPLVWIVQRQNAFSFKHAPLTPDQGLCPWTPLRAVPQTPVIGSRSALAMSSTRAFCPPYCFRPGDAPDISCLSVSTENAGPENERPMRDHLDQRATDTIGK